MNDSGQCPKCGEINPLTATICHGCFSRLPWAAPPTKVLSNSSPQVGAPAPAAPLAPPTPPVTQGPYQPAALPGGPTTLPPTQARWATPHDPSAAPRPSPIGCLPLLGGFLLALSTLLFAALYIGPVMPWIIYLSTVVWVGLDAAQIGVKRGQLRGFGNLSVASWVVGCLCLWGVVFPAYLLARPTLKALNNEELIPEPVTGAASAGLFALGVASFCLAVVAFISYVGNHLDLYTNKGTGRTWDTQTDLRPSPPIEPRLAPQAAPPVVRRRFVMPTPTPPPPPIVTASEYNLIEEDMSYSQVTAIIGDPGKEMGSSETQGYHSEMYSWENDDGSGMDAMFQNDKLVRKSQYGLQ